MDQRNSTINSNLWTQLLLIFLRPVKSSLLSFHPDRTIQINNWNSNIYDQHYPQPSGVWQDECVSFGRTVLSFSQKERGVRVSPWSCATRLVSSRSVLLVLLLTQHIPLRSHREKDTKKRLAYRGDRVENSTLLIVPPITTKHKTTLHVFGVFFAV